MKQFIFWASYAYLPFVIGCATLAIRKDGFVRLVAMLTIAASSVLAYARFVEPRILTVHEASVSLSGATDSAPEIRLAVFADTHFGIFTNAMPMTRIAARINKETPDAVFIAGDFLYHLDSKKIPTALDALSEVEAPIFAVLGNHDVGHPGPIYTAELYAALQALGVTLVENRASDIEIGGHRVLIAGTSDLWQRRQDFSFREALPDLPLIILTHNPDTALITPPGFDYDLMLAGHTHGGQIRIPGLVQSVIPTQYPFDKGLHQVPTSSGIRQVYVTTGTGMVGLPMRFNMPPRIDMLTVKLPETTD